MIETLLSSSVTDYLHGQGPKGKMARSVTKAILRKGAGNIISSFLRHSFTDILINNSMLWQ
jgi:hypothetical protein